MGSGRAFSGKPSRKRRKKKGRAKSRVHYYSKPTHKRRKQRAYSGYRQQKDAFDVAGDLMIEGTSSLLSGIGKRIMERARTKEIIDEDARQIYEIIKETTFDKRGAKDERIYERTCQSTLLGALRARQIEAVPEQWFGRERIDIFLPKYKFGIELKCSPDQNELHRLLGQVSSYIQNLDFLFVVVINPRQHTIPQLQKVLENNSRVKIIEGRTI